MGSRRGLGRHGPAMSWGERDTEAPSHELQRAPRRGNPNRRWGRHPANRGRSFQEETYPPYADRRQRRDYDLPYTEARHLKDYGVPRHQRDYNAPYVKPYGEPRHQQDYDTLYSAPGHQNIYDEYSSNARDISPPPPPPPNQSPPPVTSCNLLATTDPIRSRKNPDQDHRSFGIDFTSRNDNAEPDYCRGHERALGLSRHGVPSPPPAPVIGPFDRPIHSRDAFLEDSQRGVRGQTSQGELTELELHRGSGQSLPRDARPSQPAAKATRDRPHSMNKPGHGVTDLTPPCGRGTHKAELLTRPVHNRSHDSGVSRDVMPPPPKQLPKPPPANRDAGSTHSRDETRYIHHNHWQDILGEQALDERTVLPDVNWKLAKNERISIQNLEQTNPSSPRRKGASSPATPKMDSNKRSPYSKDKLTPKRMSSSPTSEVGNRVLWPIELGYDEALAILCKDENFSDFAFNQKQENPAFYELINVPYDPSVTVGAYHLNTYLLMKNDILTSGNKYVENMIHTAGQIWSRIFDVEPPLIRVPETTCEYVYFKMQSMEDKVKVLKMCQNDVLQERTQFMGRPTMVKDVCVAPFPLLVAQRGTRQEALDALLPLREIKYDYQVLARSDSIKRMLKDVVLKVRETLACSLDSDEAMAHRFYDNPALKDLVRMGKLTGYSRFNTIDLGYHQGKPSPGIRVFYGPDDARKAFMLPLEDCSHISPAIIETAKELFGFLIERGFAIHDPWNCQGNLVKFRVMMNSFGRMIVTVELTLDDEFVESFEPVVHHRNPNQFLKGELRPMYPLIEEPSIIPGYEFMRENSLEGVPPTRTLIKSGGLEQLKRIKPVLKEFHLTHGQQLRISGMFVTWYFVNERPVEWDRNSKIWHHVCGSNFMNEVIMDVPLCIYPNLSCSHFPHIQAFPRILQEIVDITGINNKSRVIVLSEYFFLAEFFGLKCFRTIFMKTEVSEKEITYLAQSLPQEAIKFVSPLDNLRKVEDLEPGGDIVIIWGGVRTDDLLRSIAFAGYRRVIFVRDGLRRVKHDKADTFVALHQISKCLFPYMALAGAVAIDVEPHGCTMPALLTVFTRAPNAPKVPLVVAQTSTPSTSEAPQEAVMPTISKQPDNECLSQLTSVTHVMSKIITTQNSSLPDVHPPFGNTERNHENPFTSASIEDNAHGFHPQTLSRGNSRMHPELGFAQNPGNTGGNLDHENYSPYDDYSQHEIYSPSDDVEMGPEMDLHRPDIPSGNSRRISRSPPSGQLQSGSPLPGRFLCRSPPSEISRQNRERKFRPQTPLFGNAGVERDSGFQPEGFLPQMGRFYDKRDHSRSDHHSPSPFHPQSPIWDDGSELYPQDLPFSNAGRNECGFPPGEPKPAKLARVDSCHFQHKGSSRNPAWDQELRSDLENQSSGSAGQKSGFENPQYVPSRNARGNKSFEVPVRVPSSPGAARRHDSGSHPRGRSADPHDFGFEPPNLRFSVARGDHESRVRPGPSDSVGDHKRHEPPVCNKRPKHGAPSTSDFDVQSIIKYILKKGGPSRISMMPIDERVEGWYHLADLKKCLKKQQNRGGVSTLPKWYIEFLREYGYPNPYKKVRMDESQPPDNVIPPTSLRPLSALNMRSPLEVLEESSETKQRDKGKGPKLMRDLTTSNPQVHIACRYIMEHGGPDCIEKFALPDKSIPGDSNVLLFLIQKCMQKHRASDGTPILNRFPRWYKQFLIEHGFPIAKWTSSKTEDEKSELKTEKSELKTEKSMSEASKSGPDGGELGPEARESGSCASGPRRGPKPGPRQGHPPYRPEVQTLVNFIMENGGPENVDTLTLPATAEKNCSTMLSVLQQIIRNSRKNMNPIVPSGRNQLVLPRWFAQFLIDYGLTAPVDAFSAADEEPSTLADILKDPKQLKEYISIKGGHMNIEMIPVNTTIPGWQMLFGLQTTIREMKKKGITFYKGGVRAYPPWYHAYLAEYEPDHYEPIPGIDPIDPVKPGSSQKLQPSKEVVQALANHIMQHGGPSAIENMPLPEDNNPQITKHINKLQACIVNQRYKTSGKITNLPLWYKKFLVDQGYKLLELYPDLNITNDYLNPEEQSAEPEQPESIWEPALPVHSVPFVADEPSNGSKQTQKEVSKKSQKWAFNYIDLVNYILENGGPDNIGNLDTSTAPISETCKTRLTVVQQKVLQMKEGISVSLPGWYIHFLEEYGFPTPITVLKESADNDDRVRHVDLTELKKYILKNGGHSKIETMLIDPSVANCKWLKKLRISLRGQIKRGGINYYPDWYWDYLAEYEPGVKLPDHVTRKNSELPAEAEDGNTAGQDQDKNKPWRSPTHKPGVAKGTIPNPPGWKEPSAHVIERIGVYIMSHGGPREIVNMPLPPVGYLGRSNLAKLQKTLKLQKEGDPLHQWLPVWYKKFLRDSEFDAKELYPHLSEEQLAIPQDKPDSNSSQQKQGVHLTGPAIGVGRTPEEILSDPKVMSAMKYIDEHGGPECVETMPAPTRHSGVDGWQLVCRLQNCFINGKIFSKETFSNLLPVWYILYLMRRGDPVPSKQYVDKFGRTRLGVDSLGNPLEVLDPPPFDFSSFDPDTYGQVVPPALAEYIRRNGGHANIEKMTIDYSVPEIRLLQKLQKNIVKQRKSKQGNVWRYPPWYRVYLAENEPEVKLSPFPTGEEQENAAAEVGGQLGNVNRSSESESHQRTSSKTESSLQQKNSEPSDSVPKLKSSKNSESEAQMKSPTSSDSKPQKNTSSAVSSPQTTTTKPSDSKPQSKTTSSADSGHRKTTKTDSKPESKTTSSADSVPQKKTAKPADPQWKVAMRELPRCRVILVDIRSERFSKSETLNKSSSSPRRKIPTESQKKTEHLQKITKSDSEAVKKTTTAAESETQKISKSTVSERQQKTAAPAQSGNGKKRSKSTDSDSQKKTISPADSGTQKKSTTFSASEHTKDTTTSTELETEKKLKSTGSECQQKTAAPAQAESRKKRTNSADLDPQLKTTATTKKRTKSTDSDFQPETSAHAESDTQKN